MTLTFEEVKSLIAYFPEGADGDVGCTLFFRYGRTDAEIIGDERPASEFPIPDEHNFRSGVDEDGYLFVTLNGKTFKGEDIAWLLRTEQWPQRKIVHKNGEKLDNRFANLFLSEG